MSETHEIVGLRVKVQNLLAAVEQAEANERRLRAGAGERWLPCVRWKTADGDLLTVSWDELATQGWYSVAIGGKGILWSEDDELFAPPWVQGLVMLEPGGSTHFVETRSEPVR